MKTISISQSIRRETLHLLALLSMTSMTMTAIVGLPMDATAKEYSIGIRDEAKLVPAKVLESPAPQIPSHKQEEAFRTSCEARFLIDPAGKTSVTLLTPSGSEEIDEIALSTLKKWKFSPATLENKPVPSSRRIRIEFEIE